MVAANSRTAKTRPIAHKKKSKVSRFFFHITYITISAVMIVPLIWIFLLSFKTQREFNSNMLGLPKSLYLGNYIKAFSDSPFLTFLTNSIIVTFSALVLTLIVSSLAGYALARIPFKGARPLFAIFILCDAVPIFVLIIPLFILIYQLKLSDSLWGLIFPYVAMRIGLSVMLMRGFFRSISSDMEDAGKIDGGNLMQIIWFIMLPIVRPGLVVTAIVNFISIWNEYFLATILLPSQSMFTLPPGLAAAFMGRFAANWPIMAAGFTLSFLPALVIFIFAQDKIVAGWTVSAK
jgi:raffinose/stachyose/melibiose transport system permease protein